jgi:PAS domain S-box-containing protein
VDKQDGERPAMEEGGELVAERLRAFFAGDIVFVADETWSEVRVLDGADDLVGERISFWGQALPAEAEEGLRTAIARARAEGLPLEHEHDYRTEGSLRRVWTRAARIWDAAGRARGWFGRVRPLCPALIKEREQGARLRAVLEQMPAAVGLCEADGRWSIANTRMREHLREGLPSRSGEETRARWRSWHPDGSPVDPMDWPGARALRGEWVEPMDFVFSDKTGADHWLRVGASPYRDPAGVVIGAICVFQEADQEKRAEQELRRLDEILRLASRVARVGFWDWQVPENKMHWSVGAYELLGYAADTVPCCHQSWEDRVHPEDRRRVSAAREQARAERSDYVCEYRILRPDGEQRWISARGRFLYGPNGECVRMVGAAVDVTERRQAEEGLRLSETRFRQLAEAMPQLVWTADGDGRVDYYNHLVHRYDGVDRSTTTDIRWERLLHPDDLAATVSEWNEATRLGRPYEIEHRLRMAAGGYRWHLSRAYPAPDAWSGRMRWFGTATDIEDQKRAQETLEETVRLRTARLRETVGDLEAFSYSIAHDMRAPLRAMQGYAGILIEEHGKGLSGPALTYLQRIATSAERLDRLIRDVLDYSRIVRSEWSPEPVEPGALLAELLDSYPDFQRARASIVVRGALPAVWANRSALTQVLSNLLSNALKFVRSSCPARVVVRGEVRGDVVRVWVEDNGIGIASEDRERIFAMFQRLHRAEEFEGTGIGLTIVRKAVERMGGRVGLESTPGRGSAFWFELPAWSGPDSECP